MKSCFLFLLLICSISAPSQIVLEPTGPLKKREKSSEKPQLGFSAGVQKFFAPIDYNQLIFSITLYHKNKQFSAGPLLFFGKYSSGTDPLVKNYGYNLDFRYVFPQNRYNIKAFIPLEFDHWINKRVFEDFYNHTLESTDLGSFPNPGYSFNLNTFTTRQLFSIRTGLGIFLWLHDNFNIQLQATFGPKFLMSKETYTDTYSGTVLGSETFRLQSDKYSGTLSASIGFRF